MAPLTVFCCGCSLRSGAITAAVLTAIGSLASLIMGVMCLTNPATKPSSSNITLDYLDTMGTILIVSALAGFSVFACLFVAIHKNSPDFVIPWLVCAMISIIVDQAMPLIMQLMVGDWIMALFLAAIMTFMIYLWLAVLSYYKELHEGRKGQGPTEFVRI